MNTETVKLRFCPSPTGYMHLGNARTALFNALYAQHCHGVFLLRIEDTDKARSKEEYTEQLAADLQWLGLGWQEGIHVGGDKGPYYQSQRQDIYDSFYATLEEKNLLYPCFCTEEQLALTRKVQRASGQPPRYPGTCRHLTPEQIAEKTQKGLEATYRFRVTRGEFVEFDDIVKGHQRFACDDMGDFIIRRGDGSAPFMYCNAIDDALMEVTHVVRGEDHLTNTPRQILILKALDLPVPTYCHISLIVGADSSPLSKRHGSRNIAQLREEGFLAAAIVNYLARLGHYYEDNGFMSLEQLSQGFTLNNLNSSPARYDEQQLFYWQKEAVLRLTQEEFWRWLGENTQGRFSQQNQQRFYDILKPNIVFPKDGHLWAAIVSDESLIYDEECQALFRTTGSEFFKTALRACESDNTFKYISETVKEICGVKGKGLFHPLRLALTGQHHGPDMGELVNLMGADVVKKRFEQALSVTLSS